MSYKTQAILATDQALLSRVAACAATQEVQNPSAWAMERSWAWSAVPGWDAAYAEAIGRGVTAPGGDETVITDSMILDAVQQFNRPPGQGPAQ